MLSPMAVQTIAAQRMQHTPAAHMSHVQLSNLRE
jgi:hypothetical protein